MSLMFWPHSLLFQFYDCKSKTQIPLAYDLGARLDWYLDQFSVNPGPFSFALRNRYIISYETNVAMTQWARLKCRQLFTIELKTSD